MNTFVAVLRDGVFTQEMAEQIESMGYIRSVYMLTDKALLIRCHADLPRVVSDSLGMSDEHSEPVVGVVFKLNGSYFGYYGKDLWDWLAEGRNEHAV